MQYEYIYEDGYPDIDRANSSIKLKHGMTAYWAKGEQLWDVDFINNFKHINFWAHISAHLWRQPTPPCYVVLPTTIINGGAIKPPIDDPYAAFTGMFTYVTCDELYVVNTPNGWRGAVRAANYHQSVEIAIYMSQPAPGSFVASYTATEPFMIENAGGGWTLKNVTSSVRFHLYKNDVQIGAMYKWGGADRAYYMGADTTFEAGDQLRIRTPTRTYGARSVALSILGRLI